MTPDPTQAFVQPLPWTTIEAQALKSIIDRYSFLDELATIESLQLRVNPFCKRSA
jgi:hypothetical protein